MDLGLHEHQGYQVNGMNPLLNPLDVGMEELPVQNGIDSINPDPNVFQEVQQYSPNHYEEGIGYPANNANGLDIPLTDQYGNIPENGTQTIPVEERHEDAFLASQSTNSIIC